MDSDATTLQNALDVLRQHYGEQVPGPQLSAEAQMRHTLEQQMGLDPLTADRVLKRLCISGQVVYVDSADAGNQAGNDRDNRDNRGTGAEPGTTATGPVISMPLTQSADGGQPLITSASPAMLMGIVDDKGGNVGPGRAENDERDTLGWLVAPAVEGVSGPVTAGENEGAESNRPQGYWRIG